MKYLFCSIPEFLSFKSVATYPRWYTSRDQQLAKIGLPQLRGTATVATQWATASSSRVVEEYGTISTLTVSRNSSSLQYFGIRRISANQPNWSLSCLYRELLIRIRNISTNSLSSSLQMSLLHVSLQTQMFAIQIQFELNTD